MSHHDTPTLDTTRSERADLTGYRATHRAIREGARQLATTVGAISPADQRRVRALQRYWKGYAAELLTHHTLEDDVFFPALAERAEEMVALAGRLDDEHHLLDELMSEIEIGLADFADISSRSRAVIALDRLADVMDRHLDLEDEEVLPLFTLHFSAAEYTTLEEQAFKAVGVGRQAVFAVPFIVRAMTDEERTSVLATAPLPLRVLHRLTRNRHERLRLAVMS